MSSGIGALTHSANNQRSDHVKHWVSLVMAAGLALATPAMAQDDRPDSVGIGVFTFTSGPAAAYGMPGRNAAELMIDTINEDGGIDGVPISATYVDEAQGTEGVVSEFRRLAADDSNQVMIAALSSGNCLALAPVAEQLEMPMLSWNCDTHQLFLEDTYEYVYRANSSTIPEFVALGIYLLEVNPDIQTVGIINPDYAFGHDAAEIFKATLRAYKPDIEFVAELFPRLGASTYQTEISRLASARPDVIFSNLWGADLENFVRQASPRGLFQNSQAVLALSETILQRVEVPDGVIAGVLGDGYWGSETAQQKDDNLAFVEAYRERYDEYPVFPSYKMANTILTMKAAYEKALEAGDGAWPSRDDIAAALDGLEVETLTGDLRIREEDNDGLIDQIVGVITQSEEYPFPVLGDMVRYPADEVTPPPQQDPFEWIAGFDEAFRDSLPKPEAAQ